ncbi:MAG: trypsin-like peptidase domain-containing protein [Parcubacteria group bacterium]|nr:trypsin-like peptidase domain-containing protein [Parcubacteria group bacterium]
MLKDNIKKVKNSIIAIGFKSTKDQIVIMGSGFAIGKNGRILTAAHLYNQLALEKVKNLVGMVIAKQEKNGLDYYTWLPLELIKKDDKNDIALFQLKDYKKTLITPLDLGDSEKIEVGDEAYFIGFPYAAQLINDKFGITLIVNKTIISNIKRDGINPNHPKNWLIVDAISNPGNSGCPLINMKTNKVIGVMTISFRIKSKVQPNLDIREPMHIAGARPINLAKELLK